MWRRSVEYVLSCAVAEGDFFIWAEASVEGGPSREDAERSRVRKTMRTVSIFGLGY